jgi:hypothetical protein
MGEDQYGRRVCAVKAGSALGLFGALLAVVWWKTIYNVKEHPLVSQSEIETMERVGGLVNVDRTTGPKSSSASLTCTKSSDHHRYVACSGDDWMQLHERSGAGDVPNVAGVLW